MATYRVLVSDKLSEAGLDLLRAASGVEVVVNTGLSPAELKTTLADFDAILIRSGTKLTADILEGQSRLKLVVRAGVGVDNVDLPQATRNGTIVMNTPAGNTTSTAEHTIAMLMALSRNIGPAAAGMKAGRWDRKQYTGTQVAGKTLGIVGLGRIGQCVARRAQGLEMKVIGFDPVLSSERAADLGVQLVREVDELIPLVDYLTLHVPFNEGTRNLINADRLSKMRQGARIINCARGGIVDEEALADAIESGQIAGAAIDVFLQEPPGETRLTRLPQVLCTPHLGASTSEAQELVAVEAAELVSAYLVEGEIRNPVNAPPLLASELAKLRIGFELSYRLGLLAASLMKQRGLTGVKSIRLCFRGDDFERKVEPLTNYFLASMLGQVLDDDLNYINAREIAEKVGIEVIGEPDTTRGDFTTLMSVCVATDQCELELAGSVLGKKFLRLVRLDQLPLDAYLDGTLLIYRHQDRPGLIGAIGTLLGNHQVNISDMSLGRQQQGGESVAVFNLDSAPAMDVLDQVRAIDGVTAAELVELPLANTTLPWLPSQEAPQSEG